MFSKMRRTVIIVAILLATASFAWSQTTATASEEPKEPKLFHLTFVVKEMEGAKVLNSRVYQTSVASVMTNSVFPMCSLRTGTKVPVQTGDGKMNYLDVGVSIDCKEPHQVKDTLILRVDADITSVQEPDAAAKSGQPAILQNQWSSEVEVPMGKPTVIFSSDEETSNRTMEVELTATSIQP